MAKLPNGKGIFRSGGTRKRFKTETPLSGRRTMAKDRDSGFHSAAGLIRYFDQEDEKALKVPPGLVVVLCIGPPAIVLYVPYPGPPPWAPRQTLVGAWPTGQTPTLST